MSTPTMSRTGIDKRILKRFVYPFSTGENEPTSPRLPRVRRADRRTRTCTPLLDAISPQPETHIGLRHFPNPTPTLVGDLLSWHQVVLDGVIRVRRVKHGPQPASLNILHTDILLAYLCIRHPAPGYFPALLKESPPFHLHATNIRIPPRETPPVHTGPGPICASPPPPRSSFLLPRTINQVPRASTQPQPPPPAIRG